MQPKTNHTVAVPLSLVSVPVSIVVVVVAVVVFVGGQHLILQVYTSCTFIFLWTERNAPFECRLPRPADDSDIRKTLL
jgi:hypothetical protein